MEYLIQDTTLTALADEVRELSGTTDKMSIDTMTNNLGDANDEVGNQADLIAQIKSAVDNLPEAGGESTEINLQTKTVTPTTVSQDIIADAEYDGLEKVTVNAIPSTYVKPAATKSATTYTPSTSDQTISAGTYCSGVQTIKGDANLISTNIVSGKTIFGVVGSAEIDSGSGGVGTIETCSGNLTFDAPPEEVTIYYVNSNMELTSLTSSSDVAFYPIKNSIIYLERWSSMGRDTGSAEQINYSQGLAAYFVSGDFTLIYA